jgi:hypothetical protein
MKSEGALRMRFFRHAESIGPMCHYSFYPWPVSRFRTGRRQGIGHAGKNMPCPSFAMSSGRLFLNGLHACIARLRFTGFIRLKRLPIQREAFIIEQ